MELYHVLTLLASVFTCFFLGQKYYDSNCPSKFLYAIDHCRFSQTSNTFAFGGFARGALFAGGATAPARVHVMTLFNK